MFYLPFEESIRLAFGLPAPRRLWGLGRTCLFQESENPRKAHEWARLVGQSPSETWALFGEAFPDASPLDFVDELAAHGETTAAGELASFVRATGKATTRQLSRRDEDLLSILYWLKRALLALDRGAYGTARAMLARADHLMPIADAEPFVLLKPAAHLIWCRFLQLLLLPDRATERFNAALPLYRDGLPQGLDLVEMRNNLHGDVGALDAPSPAGDQHPNNIFGGSAEPYRAYLAGRALLMRGRGREAIQCFSRSLALLDSTVPRDHFSRTREIMARICLGRAEALDGNIEQGLFTLQQARLKSQGMRFAPGEFFALKHIIDISRQQTQGLGPRKTSPHKELWLLAKESKIGSHILESGCRYAESLLEEGRPNKANYIAESARATIGLDSLAQELEHHKDAVLLANICERTSDARDLAIEPLSAWGLTAYALKERDFVRAAAANGDLVSASGSVDSGRHILLRRVVAARGQLPPIEIHRAKGFEGIATQIAKVLEEDGSVILNDVDLWATDHQNALAQKLLTAFSDSNHRIYATLRHQISGTAPTSDQGALSNAMFELLKRGAFEVVPIAERERDLVIFARGILVRKLEEKGVALNSPSPRRLFFKGAACAYIRKEYPSLAKLFRAMSALAERIDIRRDVVEQNDGRLEIPVEALERHLGGATTTAAPTSDSVKTASAEDVRQLAATYDGRLELVAKAAGISRPTLYRAWVKSGVIQTWWDQPQARNKRRGNI